MTRRVKIVLEVLRWVGCLLISIMAWVWMRYPPNEPVPAEVEFCFKVPVFTAILRWIMSRGEEKETSATV